MMAQEAMTAEEFAEYLNEKAELFEQLRKERHEAGAAEYGSFTFLENDVVRMMIEELADTANYCTMQAIKLLMLQDTLEVKMVEQGFVEDDDAKVELGFQAFKGTKDVGWGKA